MLSASRSFQHQMAVDGFCCSGVRNEHRPGLKLIRFPLHGVVQNYLAAIKVLFQLICQQMYPNAAIKEKRALINKLFKLVRCSKTSFDLVFLPNERGLENVPFINNWTFSKHFALQTTRNAIHDLSFFVSKRTVDLGNQPESW